jgi:hypothetical protein
MTATKKGSQRCMVCEISQRVGDERSVLYLKGIVNSLLFIKNKSCAASDVKVLYSRELKTGEFTQICAFAAFFDRRAAWTPLEQ